MQTPNIIQTEVFDQHTHTQKPTHHSSASATDTFFGVVVFVRGVLEVVQQLIVCKSREYDMIDRELYSFFPQQNPIHCQRNVMTAQNIVLTKRKRGRE